MTLNALRFEVLDIRARPRHCIGQNGNCLTDSRSDGWLCHRDIAFGATLIFEARERGFDWTAAAPAWFAPGKRTES